MNCRDSESLILAERDGALPETQLASLFDHVGGCPACAELRRRLAESSETYRSALHAVAAPDANEAWRMLQTRLHSSAPRPVKRSLAPILWFAAPLAAAAVLALAFLTDQPTSSPSREQTEATRVANAAPPPPLHDPSFIAGADYVEAGDPDASVMVFVDQESGWLVVWATSPADAHSG